MDFQREAEIARDLALAAGNLALDLQGRVAVREKAGGEGPVTEADLAVETLLIEGLERAFPGAIIVSEETRALAAAAPLVWCLDPIDGTREYASGRGEFAVQVGLLHEGEPVAGAIVLPAARAAYWGWRGGGAHSLDGPVELERAEDLDAVTAVHTRSHMSRHLKGALDTLGIRHRIAAGGVGYKAAQLLRGRAQLYLHTGGGLSWWDTAGPAAVLLAGGATVTNAEGAPLRFRDANKHPHGLLCAAPGLAPLVLARLGLQ